LYLGHRLAASEHAGQRSRRRPPRGHDPAHRPDRGTAAQVIGFKPGTSILGGLARPKRSIYLRRSTLLCGFAAVGLALPAAAQEKEPYRYRVTLGAHAYPSYPGSDSFDIGPLVNIDRERGDEPFDFEAADDGFGFTLIDAGPFSAGPAGNFEGKRTSAMVGTTLPTVKFSLEAGAFAAVQASDNIRLRAELRKGVTGHKGWIGLAGADYVLRDGDAWLFSIGPRVTWSDDRYQDVWFGVAPADAPAAGLPAFDADGGIQAYGATASFLTALSPRWGLYTYAKYDRLTGDAANSPLVLTYGSRDQFSGGIALSYTFGSGVD
jgi:outer membrane protein